MELTTRGYHDDCPRHMLSRRFRGKKQRVDNRLPIGDSERWRQTFTAAKPGPNDRASFSVSPTKGQTIEFTYFGPARTSIRTGRHKCVN